MLFTFYVEVRFLNNNIDIAEHPFTFFLNSLTLNFWNFWRGKKFSGIEFTQKVDNCVTNYYETKINLPEIFCNKVGKMYY